jgi:hypothetical protein
MHMGLLGTAALFDDEERNAIPNAFGTQTTLLRHE